VAQLDGTNNLVARFVYGSKPNVPDYMVTSGGTYRILSDHLGSPRAVVDVSSGNLIETINFDEFGNETDTLAGAFPTGYVRIPFGFAGGLYDPDTGLVRFGARDYDASVGRWTRKDPIGFGGGMNMYRYVGNDPIDFHDPRGTATYTCYKPLQSLSPFQSGSISHSYVCVTQGGHVICGSFNPTGSMGGSPGCNDPSDTLDPTECRQDYGDDACMESCVATTAESPQRPWYSVVSYNCHDWTQDTEQSCFKQCHPGNDTCCASGGSGGVGNE
jgi:RHS repeat-associated protein